MYPAFQKVKTPKIILYIKKKNVVDFAKQNLQKYKIRGKKHKKSKK